MANFSGSSGWSIPCRSHRLPAAPCARSVFRMTSVDSACFIRTLSVSSSSRNFGSRPVSSRVANTPCRSFHCEIGWRKCSPPRLPGRPASSQGATAAGFPKDPVSDRLNEAAVLRNRDELRGGLGPRTDGRSEQGLRSGDLSGLEADFGLIVGGKFCCSRARRKLSSEWPAVPLPGRSSPA